MVRGTVVPVLLVAVAPRFGAFHNLPRERHDPDQRRKQLKDAHVSLLKQGIAHWVACGKDFNERNAWLDIVGHVLSEATNTGNVSSPLVAWALESAKVLAQGNATFAIKLALLALGYLGEDPGTKKLNEDGLVWLWNELVTPALAQLKESAVAENDGSSYWFQIGLLAPALARNPHRRLFCVTFVWGLAEGNHRRSGSWERRNPFIR